MIIRMVEVWGAYVYGRMRWIGVYSDNEDDSRKEKTPPSPPTQTPLSPPKKKESVT